MAESVEVAEALTLITLPLDTQAPTVTGDPLRRSSSNTSPMTPKSVCVTAHIQNPNVCMAAPVQEDITITANTLPIAVETIILNSIEFG